MGRELQKRKRRSSRPATKQPTSNRPKRLRNPLGSDVVARAWDKSATTTQNYRRLGLVGRLKAATGGVEPDCRSGSGEAHGGTTKPRDPFAIAPVTNKTIVSEARVERDADGKIVRVLHDGKGRKKQRPNPLNDPLNELESDSGDDDDDEMEDEDDDEEEEEPEPATTTTEVVRQLELQANLPRIKKRRTQSPRELEWLRGLVAAHGDDVKAMARDRRRNPMQQTPANLARRIEKMQEEEGEEGAVVVT